MISMIPIKDRRDRSIRPKIRPESRGWSAKPDCGSLVWSPVFSRRVADPLKVRAAILFIDAPLSPHQDGQGLDLDQQVAAADPRLDAGAGWIGIQAKGAKELVANGIELGVITLDIA